MLLYAEQSLELWENEREKSREEAVQSSPKQMRMVWPRVQTAQPVRTDGSGLYCGDEAEPTGYSEKFIARESRRSTGFPTFSHGSVPLISPFYR